ncbi:MAG TPA: heavy-metal-associated domain-containing protein [Polyangium sp.]|nr:heavy-metal-associated domain-containing protein [Polyangium sp.]
MNETLLHVDGMSCPSCIRHIDSALRGIPGVEKVDVKLHEGTVLVKHDPSSAPTDALIEALLDAGYTSRARAA